MHKLLRTEHALKEASGHRLKSSPSFVELGERGWYAEVRHHANRILIG